MTMTSGVVKLANKTLRLDKVKGDVTAKHHRQTVGGAWKPLISFILIKRGTTDLFKMHRTYLIPKKHIITDCIFGAFPGTDISGGGTAAATQVRSCFKFKPPIEVLKARHVCASVWFLNTIFWSSVIRKKIL